MKTLYIDMSRSIPRLSGDTKIIQGKHLATTIKFTMPAYMSNLTYILKFKPYRMTSMMTDSLTTAVKTK